MSGKSNPSTAAEQCLRSAVKQLKGLLKQAETGEKVDMAAVKELTAVMKELVKLRQAMAAEKEEKVMEVRVVMEQEVAGWSE